MKKVYCIVVTYNGYHWIDKCLKSLISSIYPCSIVVIDNGSTDETVSFTRKNFLTVTLKEAGENLGFGQANNLGIRIALENDAEYIFLLNQDAWIETDTISRLIQVQLENSQYGILSPVHLQGDARNFDFNFYNYLLASEINEFMLAAFFSQRNEGILINTTFVNAASWLLTASCIRKTGGFDPVFFHYGEDVNYSQRVLYQGFKIGIYTGAKIFHDREKRLTENQPSWRSRLKRDRINFLAEACNIHNPGYIGLYLRRLLRYTYKIISGIILLNKESVAYNSGMAKSIFSSFSKVRKSRSNALSVDKAYYLN